MAEIPNPTQTEATDAAKLTEQLQTILIRYIVALIEFMNKINGISFNCHLQQLLRVDMLRIQPGTEFHDRLLEHMALLSESSAPAPADLDAVLRMLLPPEKVTAFVAGVLAAKSPHFKVACVSEHAGPDTAGHGEVDDDQTQPRACQCNERGHKDPRCGDYLSVRWDDVLRHEPMPDDREAVMARILEAGNV